jgi:hypothetical protein
VGKSVGEHEDDEGNSIWVGGEEVLTGEVYQWRWVSAGGERRRCLSVVVRAADFGPGKHQEDDAVLKEVVAGSEVAFHGEVPVEEAADGKLAVVARTICHWRRMMGQECGRSSGGAS